MTANELKVLDALFKYASGLVSDQGCNDISPGVQKMLSKEEWTALFKEMHAANESTPYAGENYAGCDWWILDHLYEKLRYPVKMGV